MKINIDKDLLLENLNVASRFASNRFSSIASLQGVLLETKDKTINIYATNLTSFFHTKIKNPVVEEQKIVFDPKKVVEFLSLLTPGVIEFSIEEKQLVIRKDKTRGSFALIDAADFPYPPILKEKEEKIKTDVLKKHLPLVLFAASSDDTRPVLNGVNFLAQDEDFTIVATDGFRLSLLKLKKDEDMPQMLVPKGFLEEAMRLAKDEKEMGLSFSEKEKVVAFSFGDTRVYSRLIGEGDFPPFEKVLPDSAKTKAIVEKDEFLRNIKIVSVFARDVSNIVLMSFDKDGITLSPKTEREGENTTLQEAEVEGESQKVAFNFKFVLDFLAHVSEKKVIVEVLRPDAPVVFRIEGNKEFLHIIMPVRIQA